MELINNLKFNINKVSDAEALAVAALETFIEEANKAIDSKGSFNVALSGGHTPERFFELLGAEPASKSLQWDKVQLFWVDERCVSPESKDSNYGLAAHTFLNKVSIPQANIHRMIADVEDYAKGAAEYEEVIRNVFDIKRGRIPEFDLIVLGMGDDGHIGSLFPTSYSLYDTADLVTVVYFMDGNYDRFTLTHPVICAAKLLVVLVSGSEKAQTLHDVFYSEPDEVKFPAHTLWPILDKVTWLVDHDAAKLI